MVTQYPHTITVKSLSGDSTQDANGNWVLGSESSFEFKGRFETNARSLFLQAADGSQIVYSGIIYAPLSTPSIALGANIEAKNGSDTVATGKALQVSRGQLNVRVWI